MIEPHRQRIRVFWRRNRRAATAEASRTHAFALPELPSAQAGRETRSQSISLDKIAVLFPAMQYGAWKHRKIEDNLTSDLAPQQVYSDRAAGDRNGKRYHGTTADADYDGLPLRKDVRRERFVLPPCHSMVSLTSSLTQEISPRALQVSTSAGGPCRSCSHDPRTGSLTDIRSVDIVDIPTEAFVEDCCAICLERFQEHQEVRALTCDHVFHATCIDRWLLYHRKTCPLCKAELFFQRHSGVHDFAREHDIAAT